jgi:hypothetical protein
VIDGLLLMSVITSSALEPASEAFEGFCGTERQKRQLRRRQLLASQNEQQPEFQNDSTGGDISDDMQAALQPRLASFRLVPLLQPTAVISRRLTLCVYSAAFRRLICRLKVEGISLRRRLRQTAL